MALASMSLSGCKMFSTCEPCSIRLSAIHWLKIHRVVFGATIADAAGFCELHVDAAVLTQMGGSPLKVESGLMRQECAALCDLS